MEEIKFAIKLECTQGSEGYPLVSVSVADKEYWTGQVVGTVLIEFTANVTLESKFDLVIDFAGNDISKYILDDNGLPTNASTLSIIDIMLDGIDLGGGITLHDASKVFVDPSETQLYANSPLEKCLDFSCKAKWVLPLASPVYIWLLENL